MITNRASFVIRSAESATAGGGYESDSYIIDNGQTHSTDVDQ